MTAQWFVGYVHQNGGSSSVGGSARPVKTAGLRLAGG